MKMYYFVRVPRPRKMAADTKLKGGSEESRKTAENELTETNNAMPRRFFESSSIDFFSLC